MRRGCAPPFKAMPRYMRRYVHAACAPSTIVMIAPLNAAVPALECKQMRARTCRYRYARAVACAADIAARCALRAVTVYRPRRRAACYPYTPRRINAPARPPPARSSPTGLPAAYAVSACRPRPPPAAQTRQNVINAARLPSFACRSPHSACPSACLPVHHHAENRPQPG